MANYGSNVTLNSVDLKITSLTPTKSQKTIKQIIGKTLSELKVVGLAGQQWELSLSGICLGTTSANLSTNRAAIEALDSVTAYAYVDGIHDGTYIMEPGTLKFNDVGDDANKSYTFAFKLVEE